MLRRLTFILSILLLLPGLSSILVAQQSSVIFLVRHAERADDGEIDPQMAMDPQLAENPPLSEAGQARASLLSNMLRDSGITHIHSTDYRRTLQTAQPTATAAGVGITVYDAYQLDVVAADLLSTPGRHLVVGHSNTTPDLVEALGGEPGLPIESMEYDRLYILTVKDSGIETVMLRFGTPFSGSPFPAP